MEDKRETYNINYGYTTFIAFLMNLRYNNSRKMEIEVLKRYPKFLLRTLRSMEKENYDITMIVEDNDFDNFLGLNKEIFTIDGKYIILNEKVSINDLYKVLNTYNFPFTGSAIYAIRNNNGIKSELKLDGIRNTLLKFNNVEEKIKSYYLSYAYGIDKTNYPEKIRILLDRRNDFYSRLISGRKEYLEDCYNEISTIDKRNPFENFLPLDSEIDYDDRFPLSEYSPYDVLNDIYMFTIFIETSNPTLYRIYEDLNGLELKFAYRINYDSESDYRRELTKRLMKSAIDTGKIVYTPRTRTQMLFYLGYIKCLEELLDKHGDIEDLKLTKYKLIYLLDNNHLNLMNEENIDKEYKKMYAKYLDEKDYTPDEARVYFKDDDDINADPFEFDWFTILIKAFIVDIFEGQLYDENLTLKKLAMIKTYYSITKDIEVIKELNKYSDHPDFWEYSKFIKGKVFELTKK